MGVRKDEGDSKADRALKLREQGLPHYLIAERIGISPNRVSYFIDRGRKRREISKASQPGTSNERAAGGA
jgi:predicted transcriptional regulator